MKFGLTFFLGVLMVVTSVRGEDSPKKYTQFYYQRASLFEKLPVSETDIVFLGNSLTNGAEWSEIFNNPNIRNRGISGDNTDGIYDRLDPIVKGKPSKIFLLCGVNDLANGESPQYIASNIARIIKKIRAESPRTKLYVQSLLPFNDEFKRWKNLDGKAGLLTETNRLIETVCRKEKIPFIPLHATFCNEHGKLDEKYTNDGLHLNGNGYMVWKEILLPYL
ncbi:MAG: GDSL-type esterase/lipase family protein [Bacteroidales bacterium]